MFVKTIVFLFFIPSLLTGRDIVVSISVSPWKPAFPSRAIPADMRTYASDFVTAAGKKASPGSARYTPETGTRSEQIPATAIHTKPREKASGFS
jgi:hypothetical protein